MGGGGGVAPLGCLISILMRRICLLAKCLLNNCVTVFLSAGKVAPISLKQSTSKLIFGQSHLNGELELELERRERERERER